MALVVKSKGIAINTRDARIFDYKNNKNLQLLRRRTGWKQVLRTTQVKLIRGGKRSQKKENQPRSVRDVIRERGSAQRVLN